MKDNLNIRRTTSEDIDRILALYPQAFPDEELRPLVLSLLTGNAKVLSLAAFDDDLLVAHVLFTLCGNGDGNADGALLAPLGVVPALQRQGLGAEIVRVGLNQLREVGISQVFVLGDPAYYGRFGFLPERLVKPLYALPDEWAEAWQSLLLEGQAPLDAGPLSLPKPWQDPALWAP